MRCDRVGKTYVHACYKIKIKALYKSYWFLKFPSQKLNIKSIYSMISIILPIGNILMSVFWGETDALLIQYLLNKGTCSFVLIVWRFLSNMLTICYSARSMNNTNSKYSSINTFRNILIFFDFKMFGLKSLQTSVWKYLAVNCYFWGRKLII